MRIPGFRLTAGLGLACGFAVGASAQPPATRPGRAATLLAPKPLAPGYGPAVVRAAASDQPAGPLATTPVTRGGPAWLDAGTDPNLVKAGATSWARPVADTAPRSASIPQRPATNPTATSPDQSMLSKGLTKLKGLSADQPPAVPFPVPGAAPRQPTPGSPVAVGQPAAGGQVLAGPPAWRWYGYGSVTPGANSFAPAGQYPRGSANWYAVTGATPGAFPVPVTGPHRMMPGNDPPAYAYQMPAVPRGPVVAGPAMSPTPIPVRVSAGPTAPPAVPDRPPVGLPTLTPPPGLTAAPAMPEPVAVKPASPETPVPLPVPAPLPVATPVSAPAPLPADDVRWQPGTAKPAAPPAAENWSPAGKGK